MALDRSVVEKAAGLARIALTPEEVERFTGQLSVVLTALERLKDVDTEKVSPPAGAPLGPSAPVGRTTAPRRIPVALQAYHRYEPHPWDRRFANPRGVRSPLLGDRCRAPRRAGRGDDRQDQPRRVRDGKLERE